MENTALRSWQKALYAAGTGAQNIFNMTLVTWSMFFYAPPAGQGQPLTPIVLFSVAMLSGRLLDAVLDPLVGYWSDRIRWRWGRRLPFIVLGGLPLALSFLLIWLPPVPGYSLYNGIYFLLMVNVYFALTTLVFVPQGALLPEIAVSQTERLSLATYNAMSAMITAAVVAVGTGPLAQHIGFRGMGAAMAAVGLVLTYAPVAAIREKKQAPSANPLRLGDAVRLTFNNRPFMAYVTGMVFFYLGFNALMGDLPYFVTMVLHQD